MAIGYCPNCGSMIVEIHQLNWKGEVSSKVFRREKARKIYERLEPAITGDFYGKIKYGTIANMAWRYGDNREIHNRLGEVVEIRRYSIDFNGTKELIESIKVG